MTSLNKLQETLQKMVHYILTIHGRVHGCYDTEGEAHAENRRISVEMHRSREAELEIYPPPPDEYDQYWGFCFGTITRVTESDEPNEEIETHLGKGLIKMLREERISKLEAQRKEKQKKDLSLPQRQQRIRDLDVACFLSEPNLQPPHPVTMETIM